MADWEDEETITTGRNFGSNNINSANNGTNAVNNDDDDWGNGGGGKTNSGGGGVVDADDDWGAGNGISSAAPNWNPGNDRRNGGGDRNDDRRGGGGGGHERHGGGGGFGGGYNRGRRDGENGVGTATTTLHYNNSPNRKKRIPSDFEKSTVEEFLHNLNFSNYDTLLSTQQLLNYLIMAFKVHVEKEMVALRQAEALAVASADARLVDWQPTRRNIEEFQQEVREYVALEQNQELRHLRIGEFVAAMASTNRRQPTPPTVVAIESELRTGHNVGVGVGEMEYQTELLNSLTNIPDMPELISTDMSSILNTRAGAADRAVLSERPQIITSTRQRRPPERFSIAEPILEEGAVAPQPNGMERNSRARTCRTRADRHLANQTFLRLCEPFQVREPPMIPTTQILHTSITQKVEFRANQSVVLMCNAGVWRINNERSDTSFAANNAQADQIFQRQQTQSEMSTSSAGSVDLPRRILSMQDASGGSAAVAASLLAGSRFLLSAANGGSMVAGGDALPAMPVAHTPSSRMSLTNRQFLTSSSGGQPHEAAIMLLPSVGDISLLGSAGSTPASAPAASVTPLLSGSKQPLLTTSSSLVPPLAPSISAGASTSSFLHRQNLSLIREEELERSRRQIVQSSTLSPSTPLSQLSRVSIRESVNPVIRPELESNVNQEEVAMMLVTEQLAAVAVSNEVLEVPVEGAAGEEFLNQVSQTPPPEPPASLMEEARRAIQAIELNALPIIREVEEIQLTNEQLQPLIFSSVMDTPPLQRTDDDSYRRNWFDVLRKRQLEFDYIELTERTKRPRRNNPPRRQQPILHVDPNEHILEAILPPVLGGRQQQLLTPDRTAPDARTLLNSSAEQTTAVQTTAAALEEAISVAQSTQQQQETLIPELNIISDPPELPAAQHQQFVHIIDDVDDVLEPTNLSGAAAAQQRHDNFVLEHHNDISLLMDNLPLVRDMMVEYNHSLIATRASNVDGAANQCYCTLPASYTYDPDLLLNADPNKLRVKHGVLKALICQSELNLKRADFIRNRMDAAIAFGFLLELKGQNAINLSADGRVSSLREREVGGGYRRNGGDGGERRFGGGDGERKFGGGDGERKFGGGGRRRFDDDFNNNNKGEEVGEEEGEKKKGEFYIPPEPTNDENEIFTSGIATGINFAKYENIPVKVSGDNVPPAIQTFENAGLREMVFENVQKSGYTVPTPIQKTAIPVIAAGRDLMACAQTGSGKTAAFLLPILSSILEEGKTLEIGKPHAIVISPTRELAIQIFTEARKFSYQSYLKVGILYGGTSSKYQNENVAKGCHILIATPGRLIDFVNRAFVTFEDTRFVVLDEADRMLDMGFLENVKTIMSHQTMSKERQTLMFSATFPEDIQRLAGEFLTNYVFIAVGVVGGACADVKQQILEVTKFNKRAKLLELLHESAEGTIVFVETKRGADFLASFFSETEFPTTSIHGDRLQRQREKALLDFKSGEMKVLIATSVASRGLDIKNVYHVINYDMPSSIDDYVHRIGRTGRVGNNGRATSFFDPDSDRPIANDLVKILEGAKQEIPDFLRAVASGGGGSYSNSKFGGVDVRGKNPAVGAPLEEEQDWN